MGQRQVRSMAIAPISALSLPDVEDVIWQNGSGVSISGNTLTKITGSTLWDAGAESQQRILSGDCAIEMTVKTLSACAIGFSATNPNNAANTITWAMTIDPVNGCYVLLLRLPYVQSRSLLPVKIGDTVKVAVEGLNINYYINAIKVGSVALTSVPYPLLVDCSIQTPNGIISNARLLKGSGLTSHLPIKGKGVERSGYRLIQVQEFTRHFYNFEYSGFEWFQVGLSVLIRPVSSKSLVEVAANITGFGVTGVDTGFHGILAIFKNGILWKPLCLSHVSPTISETFQSVSKQWIDEDAESATYDLRVRCLEFADSTSGGKLILKSFFVRSTDRSSFDTDGLSDGQEQGEHFGECSLTAKEWYQD